MTYNISKIIKTPWLWIVLLDLFIFISIFVADNKLLALYKYGWFLLGVGFFWLTISANYSRIKLIYAFLAGVFLQAVLGIWQFLFQSSFACKYLGLASHNPADLGVSVVETLSGQRWLRAYGGLDHPNMLGGLLTVGIILIIYIIIYNFSRNTQHTTRNKININIASLYVICYALCAGLFFTFSRASWTGLIVGILTMLVISIIKKQKEVQIRLFKLIAVSSIFIFILFSIYSDLVITRLSSDTRLEQKSNIERIESFA